MEHIKYYKTKDEFDIDFKKVEYPFLYYVEEINNADYMRKPELYIECEYYVDSGIDSVLYVDETVKNEIIEVCERTPSVSGVTMEAYSLLKNSKGHDEPIKMEIDGVELDKVVSKYQFNNRGIHTVKFYFDKNKPNINLNEFFYSSHMLCDELSSYEIYLTSFKVVNTTNNFSDDEINCEIENTFFMCRYLKNISLLGIYDMKKISHYFFDGYGFIDRTPSRYIETVRDYMNHPRNLNITLNRFKYSNKTPYLYYLYDNTKTDALNSITINNAIDMTDFNYFTSGSSLNNVVIKNAMNITEMKYSFGFNGMYDVFANVYAPNLLYLENAFKNVSKSCIPDLYMPSLEIIINEDFADVDFKDKVFNKIKHLDNVKLPLNGFDLRNVTTLNKIRDKPSKLIELNIDFSKIKDYSYLFYNFMYMTTEELNQYLSQISFSSCESMKGMFECCYNLTSIDLSMHDMPNVTNMSGAFDTYSSSGDNLVSVKLCNTSKVTDMSNIFKSCKKLELVDFSDIKCSADTLLSGNYSNMFGYITTNGVFKVHKNNEANWRKILETNRTISNFPSTWKIEVVNQ